jgi:hypothetical protein
MVCGRKGASYSEIQANLLKAKQRTLLTQQSRLEEALSYLQMAEYRAFILDYPS